MSHDNTAENEQILEQLRPRMRAARVGQVRRLVAGLAVVPLLGFGAVAMAADGSDAPSTETASAYEADDGAPDVNLPDIGDSDGDTAGIKEPAPGPEVNDEGDSERELLVTTSTTAAPVDDEVHEVDLGALGWAEVEQLDDGSFVMLTTDFAEGWEVFNAEFVDGKLVIIITNGEQIKAITIKLGLRDELSVIIEEVIVPTTTTKKPPVEQPPVTVDRVVVEVPGKGSFVVEREGETLFLGNVQVNEGYTYDIIKAEGWKVYVAFTNGEWIWYGKAFINDNGQIEQLFWDEQKLPDPIYQWVEIPEVGAAKFKLYDGQIWVKALETAVGFGAYDYNQGQPGATAKVDFEGEGVLWYIDVWINEAGEMAWSTTDASPAPPASTTTVPEA